MCNPENERFKILVVDDDPSVLSTYRRLLSRSGYSTITVDDPVKVLADGSFDPGVQLLLLDYQMPGMDGLTLLEGLRRRGCTASCILISAFLNDDVRERARALGVDLVLDKPVDVGLLRRSIADLL